MNDKKRVAAIAAALTLTAVAIAVICWPARDRTFTDDAYVHGNQVQLAARTAGTVVTIHADNTYYVRKGQVLLELDATDTSLALAAAEANLAATVRDVRQLFKSADVAAAELRQRQVERAQRRGDFERRTAVKPGSITREDLEHARSAYDAAQAALVSARERLASIRALTAATTVVDHPRILRAKTTYREAYLAFQRTKVISPVDGYVARRSVQVGQRVDLATPLMVIVPLDQVWVEANFKEVELAHVRIGQPVSLIADFYDGRVTYAGKVVGLAPGTGSAFALLPPQNATGNWVKIVQRLPVRIELDSRQLSEHPLRLGLSMRVTVDTSDRSGLALALDTRQTPVYATNVYEGGAAAAESHIDGIVQAHLGTASAQ